MRARASRLVDTCCYLREQDILTGKYAGLCRYQGIMCRYELGIMGTYRVYTLPWLVRTVWRVVFFVGRSVGSDH